MWKNEVLISTEELERRLDDGSIGVVEVDEDTSSYEEGHLRGAVALDWKAELHDLPRRDFISAAQLAGLLVSKGVSSEQAMVLYGGNSNWFAAYAYWLCKLRGIDNVRLLDGGRHKWELEGRALTTEVPNRSPANFETGEERPELRIFRDEAIRAAQGGDGCLVDVRSAAEYSGEVLAPPHLPQEQPYVAGHIPGARNIPWAQATNEDGSFRSIEDLRALYSGEDITPDRNVITYCRIGERSAHTWFVLSELLGYASVRNFDGSWTEYGSLVGVPVEVGAST